MTDCKLDLLKTEFSPYKITLVIELVPVLGEEFSLPMDDAGKKLSEVANYARATFGVRTAPVSSVEASPENKTGPKTGAQDKTDRQQARMAKTLNGGQDRAIQVLEKDLKLAKESKDPAAIERATRALERGQKQKARTKAEHADE